MTDKKEPPFFNDDNFGVVHYKLPFYETMELFIETLTGTCFQLRVSPFETVISVKAKIQRLEGIPVTQQHLIWNSLELEDEYCLHDYRSNCDFSISEGCTLKLVLAMRGGPINTRRVTVDDSVKETSECLDFRRDEVWEKSLLNKQVTFLVYKEGDKLNFLRVVDRGDGTLTPVSESLRGGSVHNVYSEEQENGVSASSVKLTLENTITMFKMKALKSKMENMNLNKKKTAKLKVRPPVGPRPCSSSLTSVRHHRMFRVLPQIGHASATHLPPVSDQQQSASLSSAAGPYNTPLGSCKSIPSLAASSIYMLQEGQPWNELTSRNIRPPSQVSSLDVASQASSLHGIKIDSPGKRLEKVSKSKARNITKISNKASKEPLGYVSNTELLASMTSSGGQESMAGPCALGSLCNSSDPPPANIHLFQEDLFRRINPLQRATYMPSGMLGSQSGPSTSIKRQGTPTYHLPPVKAPAGSKKKTSKHCFLCGKKTGLATSYECRCGNNFCSTHRYAETHNCTYDYKSAGRRFLQESNPIISAPKLPKI
ncbi:AN1-type zinc finger protein 4 isoform X6 [Hoplias malabaricus]|uniref:AN1-type zinc finger protein 4 isoform X6 n=1 Tax=Hoplias malabaricus TaxID=27720 RepID=UPI003461966C